MNPSQSLTSPRLLNREQQQKKEQLFEAGNEAFDAEAYQAAFECYHRASLIDPGDAEVWNALGLTYANMDFPHEAWRSYRLALQADPDNINALWYSAEFLYNQEDFELSQLLVQRYLQLEDDPEQREEAEQLLQELNHLISEEPPAPVIRETDDEDAPDDNEEAELPAGFDNDDENAKEQDDDDFGEDDNEDGEAYDSGGFYAGIELQLQNLGQTCSHCSAALPADAPYCYACHAPCFYKERADEA